FSLTKKWCFRYPLMYLMPIFYSRLKASIGSRLAALRAGPPLGPSRKPPLRFGAGAPAII
ncbi:MAG: hypothetical protein AAB568_01425, partial [Patescibacteria group bacterium]